MNPLADPSIDDSNTIDDRHIYSSSSYKSKYMNCVLGNLHIIQHRNDDIDYVLPLDYRLVSRSFPNCFIICFNGDNDAVLCIEYLNVI